MVFKISMNGRTQGPPLLYLTTFLNLHYYFLDALFLFIYNVPRGTLFLITQENTMGKIISVSNQKGGVGKTTTSTNLCACLANFGKKILLVDLDPQGNATSGIGIDKKNLSSSVYDCLIDEKQAQEVIIPTNYDNFFILPSHPDLTGAEVTLSSLMARDSRLKIQLESIKDQYDFIIIDCPPSLGLLTINAFTASDTVLIPIQCEYYALEGLSQLIATIDLVKRNLNTSLEVEGILLTMCDQRTNLAQQVIDDVKNHFHDKVYNTIIPRTVKLSEAPGFGKPIMYYEPKSVGTKTYIEAAKEFLARNNTEVKNEIETANENIETQPTENETIEQPIAVPEHQNT